MNNPLPEKLQSLLAACPALWRASDLAGSAAGGIPTGYPELDAVLPGGGWPAAALAEIVAQEWGIGELQLLLPAMRAATQQGRWLVWVAPPYLPYAPALAAGDIDTNRIVVVRASVAANDALWSMEQALRSDACALVFAWLDWLPNAVLRRLQLAAEAGGGLGVLFRRRAVRHSPAALRLRLRPAPAGVGVEVLKARGTMRYRSIHLPLQ